MRVIYTLYNQQSYLDTNRILDCKFFISKQLVN
jgi:hypothetical protein